jgi:hypothetical protein
MTKMIIILIFCAVRLMIFYLLCSQTVSGSDGKFIKVLLLLFLYAENIFGYDIKIREVIIAF